MLSIKKVAIATLIFQENIHYFLNKPAINKTNDAPTTDVTNEPISPSPEPIPRSLKIRILFYM